METSASFEARSAPSSYPTAHLRANRSAREYVCTHAAAKAHAESWNAALKRAITGVWHWISAEHLVRYRTETAFRWNLRNHGGRRSASLSGKAGRVTWKALTA
jgi:hypothetical protein